jgi:mannonate dehydratase
MLRTWRWLGPDDPLSLENVAQAGAAGVVSALPHMNQGEVWSEDEVSRRQGEIRRGRAAYVLAVGATPHPDPPHKGGGDAHGAVDLDAIRFSRTR